MSTDPIGPERWAEVYRGEFPRLYRALLAVLRDPDRALDAIHDAFLEGLRRPPPLDHNLGGWIFRVALRRARRSRLSILRIDPGVREQNDQISQALARLEVDALLASLSERQRAIVVAQFYLGLEQREIAELFGIRPGTVSATLAQAKARMRTEAGHGR